MLLTLAALAALALPQTDTTIAVRPGTRLDVNNFGGSITVKAWNQNTVRVQADHSSRDEIDISAGPTVVAVRSSSSRGAPHSIDYIISVPAATSLTLSGVYTDITVEGVTGEVTAESVQGEIICRGGAGNVSLKSVEGALTLANARGRIDLNTVDDNITVSDVVGDISAESVDGDITLTNIESSNIDLTTVDGGVSYDGTIKDGGHYSLSTHDGDVELGIPTGTNATVSVSTFDGDFDADFPVSVTNTTKRRFTFTLGTGSARVELESFDGDIHLRRPGQAGATTKHKPRNHNNNEDNDP
jgi:DUF4097 and DUF4098 domain-containing protein YvlB